MTKIRKVKRKKKFRMNVNRKRLRNKLRKLPTIGCPQIKQSWEVTMSTRTNLKQMGLAYDPNQVLKIPNAKRELIEDVKRKIVDPESITEQEEDVDMIPAKSHVVEELEAEAKAPRRKMFRLPKSQVHFLTNLIDKYGEDFKAMARDKKNYYQLTWKQIRAKIKMFKGIPEQYNEYLQSKNTE
ncbi:PREDICTED: nucleolar protein 16 [Dufourea novaeangliae]|uniref:Nucleolar protein 16 n=1 Tax=Dufourea novaeangliae TaxID=178035 RepID=A0A154P9Z1_DUFNO|nr:PREDICTED: nucleolar protein 16 [Dufourea novaeangliae]KZC08038.1 Nucleolar protein 16 [Dufourea novaeangliae]